MAQSNRPLAIGRRPVGAGMSPSVTVFVIDRPCLADVGAFANPPSDRYNGRVREVPKEPDGRTWAEV